MKRQLYIGIMSLVVGFSSVAQDNKPAATRAKTQNGMIEGYVMASGVRTFKGVPFAEPPVGKLRWAAPQPLKNWEGVRKTDTFGPRAMQLPVFSDMNFRSNGMSEDCLYLNVWTPAKSVAEKLPVLVYFYGGGFVGGDGSEYRYDGESLATRGIVTVTINYRLGIFGFISHPDLTKESAHHSSGNYGLMDQHAALVWVQRNISAFGGDPKRVTIAGESAGSIAVCAQMASPLSKGLFAGAIGESGGMMGSIKPASLAEGEQNGVAFVSRTGKTMEELRAMPAEALLKTTENGGNFPTVVDGYFLPNAPADIFLAGGQMHVPLLAGWNSMEGNYTGIIGKDEPTAENYEKAVRKLYGDKADAILGLYKAGTPDEVKQAATDLASDRFIGNSTWQWIILHTRTGGKSVYRYVFNHPRPPEAGAKHVTAEKHMGAGHSWEIEYALGNLLTNKVYAWVADDQKVGEIMEGYFASFIRTGDPNEAGLPEWPVFRGSGGKVQWIDLETKTLADPHPERYKYLMTLY